MICVTATKSVIQAAESPNGTMLGKRYACMSYDDTCMCTRPPGRRSSDELCVALQQRYSVAVHVDTPVVC